MYMLRLVIVVHQLYCGNWNLATSSLILSWKMNHSYNLTTLEALHVSASPGKIQWSLVIWARRKSNTARGLRVIVLRFDTWDKSIKNIKSIKVLHFYFERNWGNLFSWSLVNLSAEGGPDGSKLGTKTCNIILTHTQPEKSSCPPT